MNLRLRSLSRFGLFYYVIAFSPFAQASVTLVVDGKLYDVKEAELSDCSTSPELAAMKLLLNAAYGTGTYFAESACKINCNQQAAHGDCDTFCATDPTQVATIKKAGLAALFSTVRNYPPAHKNESCAQGRAVCEEKCAISGIFDEKRCTIECNQYETYFKK